MCIVSDIALVYDSVELCQFSVKFKLRPIRIFKVFMGLMARYKTILLTIAHLRVCIYLGFCTNVYAFYRTTLLDRGIHNITLKVKHIFFLPSAPCKGWQWSKLAAC